MQKADNIIKDNIGDISFDFKTDKTIVETKNKIKEKPGETKRQDYNKEGKSQSKCFKLCKKPFIYFWIALIVAILIAVAVIVIIKLKKPKEVAKIQEEEVKPENEYEPGPDTETFEEQAKIKKEFEILTKPGDLKQISVTQKSKEETKVNGQIITTEITRKTNYDVYFRSQEKAEGENQDYYSKMTSGVVSIRGECTSSTGDDCEPKPLLELTKVSNNSQRNVGALEDLKDIPLPVCFFNITDNHIITTLSCPESLSDIKRNEIILDLYFFRPPAAERADKENDNITLIIEKDPNTNQTLIHEINGGLCNIFNNWGSQCTTDMKTVIDQKGNLLSYDEEAITIINYDEKNSYIKDKVTNLIDASEKVQKMDIQNYENALNDLLPLMEPYMKEEIQFTQNDFKDLLNVIEDKKKSSENQNYIPKKTRNTFRNLADHKTQYIKKASLFSNKATPIEVNLDLKINSGVNSPISGAYGSIIFDDKEIKYSTIEEASMLEDLIDKLSSFSKAGNQLASELYDKVYDKLEEAINEITIQITSLDELIKYYEIFPVFNSTLVKYSYNVLPAETVQISNELLNRISGIFFNLKTDNIKENADILYSNIHNYIDKLHDLIREMLNSLGELSNILTTKNNTFTEIINHYMNNTSTSYVNIINKMKSILANYYIKEFAMVHPKIQEIINLFEQNTNESLKDEILYLEDLYDKLQKKIFKITSISESEEQTVLSNLDNSIQYYYSTVEGIKNYLVEIMNIKPNGFFISDEDIAAFDNSFTHILSEADEVAKKLNNVKIIDQVFDEIMIKFRDNYIFSVKFMEQIKSGNFTLEEDVLNTTLFSQIIKNQLDNGIRQLCDEIINKIKRENDVYLSKINNYFDIFLDNNSEELNNIISDLVILFSEEGLKDIIDSFELSLNLFSQKITNIINKNIELTKQYFDFYYYLIENNKALQNVLKNHYLNYTYIYEPYYSQDDTHQMTGIDIIIGKMRTSAYLTKYNIFMANLNYSEEYLKEEFYFDVMNEYREAFIQMKDELLSLLNNNLLTQFPDFEKLQFLEKHMKIVEKIKTRLDKHFSIDYFINKISIIVDESVKANINSIQSTKEYIKTKHNSFTATQYYDDESNDICVTFKRKVCYGCTNCNHHTYFLDRFCFILSPYHYNYLEIKKISYEPLKNYGNLSDTLNKFNIKIKEKIDVYNEIIDSFNINITIFKEETLNEGITINLLNNLQEWILSTMHQQLENNLLQSSYNYYQQNIERKTRVMFEDIFDRWKNCFNTLKDDVGNNIDNLKSSTLEFSTMTLITKTIIQTDFFENYLNSIIYFQRSELNYTVSYYYNYFYKIINKAYKYLINKIPKNENNFNEILIERKEEIKNYFENFFKDLANSEIYYLSLNNQLNILQINEIDFFKVRSILLQYVQETDEVLENTMDQIAIYEMYSKPGDDYSLVMRLYLENKELGKLIEEFFEPLDKGEFFYLEIDKFKDVLYDNWIFDNYDFINILNNALYQTNKEVEKELLLKLEEYSTLIEDEINKYFDDNVENVINDLFQKQIREITPNQNITINQNIKDILNVLDSIIKSESNRIQTNPDLFNFDVESIKNYLTAFRNRTIIQITDVVFDNLNYFYEKIYEDAYTNCISDNLDTFLAKTKNIIDSVEFVEYELLNSSYKIGEIIYNLTQEVIEDYKITVTKKINSKYSEYYQKIKEAINLEQIYNDIINFFDNAYQKILLPYMTTSDNCISSNCPLFEFSEENNNLIISTITQKMNEIKNVMVLTKGSNYQSYFPCYLDFTNSGINVIKPICESLKNFLSFEKGEQVIRINEFIQNFIKTNLEDFLNNTVPIFGNQFFERIIDYNINFKVIVLYENLHYAFGQTLGYYHSLNFLTDSENLPSDIKIRLYQLNDLDITILNKEQEIKILLEEKLNELIIDLKDSAKQAYTHFLKENADIRNSFSSSILEKIDFNLDEIMPNIEKNYKTVLDKFLKEKFMNSFSEILNERSQDTIKDFYEEKRKLQETLDPLFSSKEDKDLNAINRYINYTLDTIQTYRNFYYSFKLSESAKDFFINYGNNILLKIFKQFNQDLNKKLKEVITTGINNNSLEIEKLDPEVFINKRNLIHDNIYNNYINDLDKSFKEYGLSREEYNNHLIATQEQNTNHFTRRLVDNEIELETKKRVESRYVEDTLTLINSKVSNTYNYINTLNCLRNYQVKIKKYNTTLNIDYKRVLDMITQNKYNEEIDTFMKEKLDNLTYILTDYYDKVYSSFFSLKTKFQRSFFNFNFYMYDVVISTYYELNNHYLELLNSKNNMSKIITNYIEEYPLTLDYNLKSENMMNNATAKIKNLQEYGEFQFNSTIEGLRFLVPKIKAKIVNKIIPKNIEVEITNGYSFCDKKSNMFNIAFNDVNLTMTVEYDTKSNYINITTYNNIEKYKYSIHTYEIFGEEETEEIHVLNYVFNLTKCNNEGTRETHSDNFEVEAKNEIETTIINK